MAVGNETSVENQENIVNKLLEDAGHKEIENLERNGFYVAQHLMEKEIEKEYSSAILSKIPVKSDSIAEKYGLSKSHVGHILNMMVEAYDGVEKVSNNKIRFPKEMGEDLHRGFLDMEQKLSSKQESEIIRSEIKRLSDQDYPSNKYPTARELRTGFEDILDYRINKHQVKTRLERFDDVTNPNGRQGYRIE